MLRYERNLLAAALPFQLGGFVSFLAKLTRFLAASLDLLLTLRRANGRFVSKVRPRRPFVLNEIGSSV
jgi:hypothetical protein